MPHAYDITTTTPSIRLSASGEGEFSFTISNALGRSVRGRILALPDGNTPAEWIALGGAADQDFASDGTLQVTVKVKVPPGTPEGRHQCHLLVASVNNPDEEYATGPTVSFEVLPAAPGKSFPWWIVALVAGVLVVGGGAALLFAKLRGPGPDDIIPPGANCQADSDCPRNQRCVEVSPGSKSCLLRPGEACKRDIDCSSFWCLPETQVCSRDDGKCRDNSECRPPAFTCANGLCRRVNGQACTSDTDCASGFCERTCKPSPPCVPACRPGQLCIRGRCQFIILKEPIFRFERITP